MNHASRVFTAFLLSTLALPAIASINFENLVVNGDFEEGPGVDVGAGAGYSEVLDVGGNNELLPEGKYAIVKNPSAVHPNATSYGDNTTGSGYMMAVNGSTEQGQVVWSQTVAVMANTTYDFAAYISSWVAAAPAELSFRINGMEIGALTAPSATGTWTPKFATWNSDASISALIEIVNGNNALTGNDFALDDIYFGGPKFSNPVPEPGALPLIFIGLGALGFARRRPNGLSV